MQPITLPFGHVMRLHDADPGSSPTVVAYLAVSAGGHLVLRATPPIKKRCRWGPGNFDFQGLAFTARKYTPVLYLGELDHDERTFTFSCGYSFYASEAIPLAVFEEESGLRLFEKD